jgi:hypothetical protein
MRVFSVSVLLLSLSLPLAAQDVHFLDCPEVVFFGPGCEGVPVEEPLPPELLPPSSPEWPLALPLPAAPVLLFPRETLAPSTPPLMLQLLNEPTEANARLFLAWSQEREARGKQVQDLLKQLLTPDGKE